MKLLGIATGLFSRKNLRARRAHLARAIAEVLEGRRYLDAPVFNDSIGQEWEYEGNVGLWIMAGDPDGGDITHIAVDWGDGAGTQDYYNGSDFFYSDPYSNVFVSKDFSDQAPSGAYNATITLTDDDTETSDPYYMTVVVANIAPTASISISDDTILEGESISVTLSGASDIGLDDNSAGFRYSFSTNPGSLATDYASASTIATAVIAPDDHGVHTVYGRVFDKDSGYSDYTATLAVGNVAPYATLTFSDPDSNGNVTVSLTNASDPSIADSQQPFKYSFNTDFDELALNYGAASSSSSAVFSESQLANGATVYARIFDKDSGHRPYSADATDMSATVVSPTQIALTWTDDLDNEAGWQVQRSTNGSTFSNYGQPLVANVESYTATGLTDGTRYWFRVRAIADATHSDQTIYSPKMGKTTYLPAMQSVTATHLDNGEIIEVEWTAPTTQSADGYDTFTINIYRAGEEPSSASLLATASVDAGSANKGAGTYTHQFLDLMRDEFYVASVRGMSVSDAVSQPQPAVTTQQEYANQWITVTYDGSLPDLVDVGAVVEEWADPIEDVDRGYYRWRDSGDIATVMFKGLPSHSRAKVTVYAIADTTINSTNATYVAKVNGHTLRSNYSYAPYPATEQEWTADSYAPYSTPIHSFSHSANKMTINVKLDDLPQDVQWRVSYVEVAVYGPWPTTGRDSQPPAPEDNGSFDPPVPEGDGGPTPIGPNGPGGSGGGSGPGDLPLPDPEEDAPGKNWVNLSVMGWNGFRTAYAWPNGTPSFVDVVGSTDGGPGIPPSNTSVFIGVNDDFDEGNVDVFGNNLPDNEADGFVGHQVDWDVAPLVLQPASTETDQNDLGEFSLSFPDEVVKIWRLNPEAGPGDSRWTEIDSEEVFDLGDWSELYEESGWWVSHFPSFLVEAIDSSEAAHDVEIIASFTRGNGGTVTDTVRFTAGGIDLDIDSDNDDGIDEPERDDEEERAEDREPTDEAPHKVILVNDYDADGDGIPGYADGYDLDDESSSDDDEDNTTKFIPLVLELPEGLPSGARIVFRYAASNPLNVEPTLEDPFRLPEGSLRLWMKDGDEIRDGRSIADQGDYIGSGSYTLTDLGMEAGGVSTLYVEAVRASSALADLSIEVSIDPDGNGPTAPAGNDRIKVTATRAVVMARNYGDSANDAFPTGHLVISDLSVEPEYNHGFTNGAFQTYVIKLYDPRTTQLSQFFVNGQALTLSRQGDHWQTTEFIVVKEGANIEWSVPYGEIELVTGQIELRYNSRWPFTSGPEIIDPGEYRKQLGEAINAAAAQMEAQSWVPANLADTGAFGREVHARASASLTASSQLWKADIYVNPTTKQILAIGGWPQGQGPIPQGTVQVDLVRLKQGQTMTVGGTFDPSKIDDLVEIKTSIGGKITPEQRLKLKGLMNGGKIFVTNGTARVWKPNKGWHANTSPKWKNVGRLLGFVAAAQTAWNVVHAEDFDQELDEIAAKVNHLQKHPYHDRPDGAFAKLQDERELQLAIKQYLSHFVPDTTALDAIMLVNFYTSLPQLNGGETP